MVLVNQVENFIQVEFHQDLQVTAHFMKKESVSVLDSTSSFNSSVGNGALISNDIKSALLDAGE
ncbi:MAG: hypothetical protein ACI9VT_003395 [Psychroserpens sp.]|jgi:hypothetical protein